VVPGVNGVIVKEVIIEQFLELVTVTVNDCVGNRALPPVRHVPRYGSTLNDGFGGLGVVYVFVPGFFCEDCSERVVTLVVVLG